MHLSICVRKLLRKLLLEKRRKASQIHLLFLLLNDGTTYFEGTRLNEQAPDVLMEENYL